LGIDELIGLICLKLRACSPDRNNSSIHLFTKSGHEPTKSQNSHLLGTQEWLTPDGQFIRNQGITPNMTVPLNASVTPLTPTVENASDMTEQQILSSGDAQLVAAIKYLEGQK
jgi:hypothetical protein